MQDDVLVAGGGPVGLCLALLLVEAGLAVSLIEPQPDIGEDLRASTFHPPTLDLLEPLGITAELLALGLKCPSWQVRLHPSGDRAVFDLAVLAEDTRHPYRLQCEQWKLSRALRARLEGRATFLAGARLTGVRPDADGVTAEITLADGTPVLRRARLLAGCDGARSAVRQALGIAFDGATYPETTLLATTQFPFEAHLEGLSNVTYCWREGGRNFSLLKVPGRWRVALYPSEDRPIDEQMSPPALDQALQEIVPRGVPYEVGEARPYRVHMRLAERYVAGRVALAGDAAHVNSPAGGMGLNGGLHDAFCLAECLTAILLGGARPDHLGLYERRRRPIARDEILGQADRNRARMRETDPARRLAMLAELQSIAADPVRARAHLRRSSMIDGLRRAAALG